MACSALSTPEPLSTPAIWCPAETAELKLLMQVEEGYGLLYPAEFAVRPPRFIVINPIDTRGDTPDDVWMDISVEAASGRTSAQVADQAIANAGAGFNITRREVLADGLQAVVVDGPPGSDPC